MTDKVQKIREGVVWLLNNHDSALDYEAAIEDVLSIIDSSQEELVSEDLEEAARNYAKEEYNRKNPATLPDRCRCCYAPLMYAFKDGAKWKKEQFEKNRLAACDRQTDEETEIEREFVTSIIEKEHRQPTFDDAIKYGMRLKKKQMMSKAIDAKFLKISMARILSMMKQYLMKNCIIAMCLTRLK